MAVGVRLNPPRIEARGWLAVAALLGLGSLLAWWAPGLAGDLAWRPDVATRQPWRAWTAAFVHLSAMHLGANLLGLVIVAWLGAAAGCDRPMTWAWLLAWPCTHAALSMQPALAFYGGLSGVLHAGVAVVAVHLLRRARGGSRRVGAALAAGLAIKVLLESPWTGPVRQAAGWDIPIAPLAHAAGAVAGALAALAFVAMHRVRRLP